MYGKKYRQPRWGFLVGGGGANEDVLSCSAGEQLNIRRHVIRREGDKVHDNVEHPVSQSGTHRGRVTYVGLE